MARLRNRRMASRKKSRAWVFTADNKTLGDVEQFCENLLDAEVYQYVFQLERGESGMVHFQGVCRFQNPRANWPAVEAHWERCRNWRASVKYCTKVDTRIGGPWTNIPNLTWK